MTNVEEWMMNDKCGGMDDERPVWWNGYRTTDKQHCGGVDRERLTNAEWWMMDD